MPSVWEPQVRDRCQHPGAGMSTEDGPGALCRSMVVLVVAPWSVPVITKSSVRAGVSCGTQRILLPRSGSGGETSGAAKTTATSAPLSLRAKGLPSGRLNPARAHSGSGPVSSGRQADGGVATGAVPDAPGLVIQIPPSTRQTASTAASGPTVNTRRRRTPWRARSASPGSCGASRPSSPSKPGSTVSSSFIAASLSQLLRSSLAFSSLAFSSPPPGRGVVGIGRPAAQHVTHPLQATGGVRADGRLAAAQLVGDRGIGQPDEVPEHDHGSLVR